MFAALRRARDRGALDTFGVAASTACAVHCLLLPLAIGLLPAIGLSVISDERTEWALVALTLGIGVTALGHGYLHVHRRARPIALFAVGMVLLVAARLGAGRAPGFELASVVIGALCVVQAHRANQVLTRRCAEAACTACGGEGCAGVESPRGV